MRGRDIKVGEEYAVCIVTKALSQPEGHNFPRTAEHRRMRVLDKVSNDVIVCEYETLVRTDRFDPGRITQPQDRHYEPGRKLMNRKGVDFICLWADYPAWAEAERARRFDGRIDKDTPMGVVGGQTFSEPRLVGCA